MILENFKKFHFVGIGGMGMRALAEILLEKGFLVSGSDVSSSDFLKHFEEKGANVFIGHKEEHVHGADCVILSSAIKENNPELMEARKLNIPVFHRSDVLACLINQNLGIAVAGAHGKSTTSAMVGQIFYEAGLDPTIVLGAAVNYIDGNSCLGHSEYTIAEADESDGSFLKFYPHISIVTNVEDDHLDHYKTVENIQKAFVQFINQTNSDGKAILCLDSEGIQSILPKLDESYVTYGFSPIADYQAVNKKYVHGELQFDVLHEGENLGTISLKIPGDHNIRNALAATICGLSLGISFEIVKKALSHFTGAKRRFQTKWKSERYWVIDDYAHHPTEINATLCAAKETGVKRVICAFQPHRYSRTSLLRDEFAMAFDKADVLLFTDIYSAGEAPIDGVDENLIPGLVKERNPEKEIYVIPKFEDISKELAKLVQPGDMVITMGAGSIYRAGEELIQLIKDENN